MDHGRIVHFEDNPLCALRIKVSLERLSEGRHKIVGGAVNLTGALAILGQIDSGELEANIVLFDGNLGGSGGGDARAIEGQIGALGLAVRTISHSDQNADELGVHVDADFPKGAFRVTQLIQAIDAMDEPTKAK